MNRVNSLTRLITALTLALLPIFCPLAIADGKLAPVLREVAGSPAPAAGIPFILEIQIPEADAQNTWSFKTTETTAWFQQGAFAIERDSLKPIAENSTRLHFRAAALASGTQVLPALSLKNKLNAETLRTNELSLQVGEPEALRDKPVWTLPIFTFGSWNWWLIGATALLLGLFFGYGLYRLFRKAQRLRKPLSGLRRIKRDFRYLKRISAKANEARGAKDFALGYARVLRMALSHQLQEDLLDLTDYELARELSRRGSVSSQQRERAISDLKILELARYGEASLLESDTKSLLHHLWEFIEELEKREKDQKRGTRK